jgi:hypothetical protein
MEIILIVCAVAVPIVALLFVLPKRKANDNAPTKEAKQPEPPKESQPKPAEEKKDLKITTSNNLSNSDLKSYAEYKKRFAPAPKTAKMPYDYASETHYFDFPEFVEPKPKKDNSISGQIKSLSPELKAMLIAGVFDKKDY